MEHNGTPDENSLTPRQLLALPYLAHAPSVAEGARLANVGRTTLYRWMSDWIFRAQIERTREESVSLAHTQLQVSWSKYYQSVLEGLTVKGIYTGLFKALVFGIIISVVGCAEGLSTSGGAVGVGKATRRSVILSYLLILIFGYFGTAIFYGKASY